MRDKLILKSMSSSEIDFSSWYPSSDEEVFICLDLEIEFGDGADGSNMFYVTIATPKALEMHREGPVLVKNRTLVVTEYSYDIVRSAVINILNECTRETWIDSCMALQRYFQWEYEDYSSD